MAYTELDLRKLKGQILKDVWHSMIGKEAGIKNTTGLKNSEEILAAILKGQDDPLFLEPFKKVRQLPYKGKEADPVVEMPNHLEPKDSGETKTQTQTQTQQQTHAKKEPQKRGPKLKPSKVHVHVHVPSQAIESTDLPLQTRDVEKKKVKRFHIGSTLVFIELETNTVYEAIGNTPGSPCGLWNPETRQICYDS